MTVMRLTDTDESGKGIDSGNYGDLHMVLEFTFTCPLPNGFHARPASHLASLANDFLSDCALTNLRNGSTADIKSVLSVVAADVRMNDQCSVRVHGLDEQAAHAALQRFVERDLAACDVPLPDLAKEAGRPELPRSLRSAKVDAQFGLAASRGIGQGKAVAIGRVELLPQPDFTQAKVEDRGWEEQQIRRSIAAVRNRMEKKLLEQLTATEAAILRAHLAIVDDPALTETMLEQVAHGQSAAHAVAE